jgi:hypothetical protein
MASALSAALLTSCPIAPPPYIECTANTDCNRFGGGTCDPYAGTDHSFCTYPDPACPGGRRWSDLDVEQPISGECVGAPDAGVDAVDSRNIDSGQGPLLVSYQAADLVLGQATFTNAGDQGMTAASVKATSVATENGTVWIRDDRGRALAWVPLPTSNGVNATRVIGRASFNDTMMTSPTQQNLGSGGRVAAGGGRLVVGDPMRNRVMIWNPSATMTFEAADVVLGQPNYTSSGFGNGASQLTGPQGAWTDGTRLAIADTLNDRVMIWTTFPTAVGQPANLVLGQPAFGSTVPPNPLTASRMSGPQDVVFDGSRFYVADTGNNRVLIWNSFPTRNEQPADLVVGQPDFASRTSGRTDRTFASPGGIAVSADALFVADFQNDRVLVFSPIPTANGAAAQFVLGQPDFTTGGNNPAPTAESLDGPRDVHVDGSTLWIADTIHNRAVRHVLNR